MGEALVRRFKGSDYPQITSWYQAWGQPVPFQSALPDLGFIVNSVACGFMYVADAKMGWMDFFISNPAKDKCVRDRALDLIGQALMEYAKKHNFMGVMTNTKIKAAKERALKHGMSDLGEFTVLFRGF